MGLKQLWQAARVVQRVVHGVEQRKIAQIGTTVNVALRKNLRLITIVFDYVGTLILASPGLHAQVASYKTMSCLSDEKDLAQSKVALSDLIC
jgi:hypothetical protein